MRIKRINRFIALFLIFTLLFGLVPNTYDVYAVEKIIEEQNNSNLEIVPNVVSGSSIKNKKEIEEIQIDQQDNELKAVPSQMKVQLEWNKNYSNNEECELIPSNEPDKNKIGSKAQCRLTLSWDGEETFDVGEIKVRMPQYIFQTRDGDDIGHYTLGIEPSGGQEGFGYYVENNEIIIFNEQKMEGAHNFICDFTYYTGCEYYPYRIKDNYIKEFSAIVQYGKKLQNQIESNSLKVCYHTDIILDRFWVNGEVCDFDVVKNRISVTDDDKDKYVYVEWTAIGNLERYTQLGNIEYQMDFDQNGVVVGYEDDKTWNTVETGSSEITLMDEIRYPYWRERFRTVLVRYEKPKVDTKFVCLSKAVVTGKDNNHQTKGASRDVCEWKETLPKEDSYGYKDGLFKGGKSVNNNLQTINEKGWYEQKIEYTIGTKIENLDALEQVQQGGTQAPYEIEITDDTIFLEDTVLEKDEYQFSHLNMYTGTSDSFVEYQQGESKEWKKLERVEGKITQILPEGVTGIRIRKCSNQTIIEVGVQLKATERLKRYFEEKTNIGLYNIASLRITDNNGKWINATTPQKEETYNDISIEIHKYLNERDRQLYNGKYMRYEIGKSYINQETRDSKLKQLYVTVDNTIKRENKEHIIEYSISPRGNLDSGKDIWNRYYILLPKGGEVENIVELRRYGSIELRENWRESGRSLLVVEGHRALYRDMTLKVRYSKEVYMDFGRNVQLNVAYEYMNGEFENGYDDEYTIVEGKQDITNLEIKELLSNLKKENDNKQNMAYTQNIVSIDDMDMAGDVESKILVKDSISSQYTDKVDLISNTDYKYCIRPVTTDNVISLKNLIIYDIFETEKLEVEGRGTWKGEFQSLDISSAIRLGIEPVVYYTTKENILISETEIPDLSDKETWTTEKPLDTTKVTGIAVDLSKTKDGQDFVLGTDAIPIYIHMRTPTNLSEIVQLGTIYNSAWMSGEVVSKMQKVRTLVSNSGSVQKSMRKVGTIALDWRKPNIAIEKRDTYYYEVAPWEGRDVNEEEPITYAIMIQNGEAREIENLVVEDIVPEELKIDYKKLDLSLQTLQNDLKQNVSYKRDPNNSQKLIFTCENVKDRVYIEIPTYRTYVGEEKQITNTAKLVEAEGISLDIESSFSHNLVQGKELYDFRVEKYWEDDNNQENTRPNRVFFKLYANGKDTKKILELGPQDEDYWNRWGGVFKDLEKYRNGEEILYTVEELDVDDYDSMLDDISENGCSFRNVYNPSPERRDIQVTKQWDDEENKEGQRPESVIVQLIKNGEETNKIIRLSKDNNWTGTFEDLPKTKRDENIKYVVKEVNVPFGYSESVTGNMDTGFTITNTYTKEEPKPEIRTIPVSIQWENEDKTANRPASVTVKLLADGKEVSIMGLPQENEWTGQLQEVTKHDETGKEIVYTVSDIQVMGVPSNYKTTVTGDMVNGFVVTNTYQAPTSETRTITVQKEWNDNNNKEGKRSTSVTVKLLADGKDTGKTIVLSESNSWKGSFTKLLKKNGTTEIKYTVQEMEVPSGYIATVAGSMDTGFIVKNSYIPAMIPPVIPSVPETRTIAVQKEWNDDNDKEGKRPTSVTVKLLANGKDIGKMVVLSENNSWTGKFTELTKYDNGQEVEYTIEEVAVPNYQSEITGNMANGFIVTNTYTKEEPKPETRTIVVKKEWNDHNNQRKQRPKNVTIQLLADGKKVGKTLMLSEGNHWSGSFKGLLQKDSFGKTIVYTIEEVPVSHYVSKISGNMQDGFVVTNTNRDTDTGTVPKEEQKPSEPTTSDPTDSKKDKPNLELELNKKKEEPIDVDSPRMRREVLKNIELFLKGQRGDKLGELELELLRKQGIEVPTSGRMTREVLRQIELFMQGKRAGELELMNVQSQQGLQGSSKLVVKTYDAMKLGMYSVCFVSASVLIIRFIWKRKKLK